VTIDHGAPENGSKPPVETYIREVEAAARPIGRQIVLLKASSEGDIDAALATALSRWRMIDANLKKG
jgi:hypothetical protein